MVFEDLYVETSLVEKGYIKPSLSLSSVCSKK